MTPKERHTFYIELGKTIRGHREACGVSQADLGAIVGLTRTSITNIESGRQGVGMHLFVELAHALNFVGKDGWVGVKIVQGRVQ